MIFLALFFHAAAWPQALCLAWAQDNGEVQDKRLVVGAAGRKQIIEEISKHLLDEYLYPKVAEQIVEHLREKLNSGAYDAITSLHEFAQRLSVDLKAINNDSHLRVEVITREFKPTAQTKEMREQRWQRYLETGRFENYGFNKVERLPGNIGYLDIWKLYFPYDDDGSLVGAQTAYAAMAFLANVDALIIDVRKNVGGRGEMLHLLCSYFFPRPIHYGTKIDQRRDTITQYWTYAGVPGVRMTNTPIYVLTSKDTGSGGEELPFVLKNQGRAVIVGETTSGGAHATHSVPLPELGIDVYIPHGTMVDPVSGKDWEGVGVEPDIAVPAEEAFEVAYTEALKNLLENETDANKRYRLEWTFKRLSADRNPIKIPVSESGLFVGTYGPRTVTFDDGALYYQRTGGSVYRLIPLGEDTFRLDGLDYFRIRFEKDNSGNVVRLVGMYESGELSISERIEDIL